MIAACLLLSVAACKHTEFAMPPEDRLVCPSEPAVPKAPVTDAANAEYLKKLRNAWVGCKSDVEWLRVWFRELDRR